MSVDHAGDAANCQLITQMMLLPVQLLMQMMLLVSVVDADDAAAVQLLMQMMLLTGSIPLSVDIDRVRST